MAVYLLHFDRPFKHARHYVGYADDVPAMHRRIDEHYDATLGDGRHHRLMQHVRAAGISFSLARYWPDGDRKKERALKHRGKARCCPICRGD